MVEQAEDYQRQIEAWLTQPPGLVASGFGRRIAPAINPLIRVGRQYVPVSLLEQALAKGSQASARLSLQSRWLHQAGVDSIDTVRTWPLQQAEQHWKRSRGWAMGLAGGTGVASGMAGAAGLSLDIPAFILQSFVGIHRAGLCFGYDCTAPEAAGFALGVFALGSANTLAEKQAAWQALESLNDLRAEALRDGLEAVVARQLGRGSVAQGMERLALQMGLNLGRRKAAAIVPVLGAVIGGSINAWAMHDLMLVARHAYIARRLGLLPDPVSAPTDGKPV